MKTKELYNAPEMELIMLGIEQGIIMTSGDQPGTADNGYGDNSRLGARSRKAYRGRRLPSGDLPRGTAGPYERRVGTA